MKLVINVMKLLFSFMAGSLISLIALSVAIGIARVPTVSVNVEALMWLAVALGGMSAWFFSFGFMMLCLSGLWIGFFLVYLVVSIGWPRMNYEELLGYLFSVGLLGVLFGGVAGRYKLRSWRRESNCPSTS